MCDVENRPKLGLLQTQVPDFCGKGNTFDQGNAFLDSLIRCKLLEERDVFRVVSERQQNMSTLETVLVEIGPLYGNSQLESSVSTKSWENGTILETLERHRAWVTDLTVNFGICSFFSDPDIHKIEEGVSHAKAGDERPYVASMLQFSIALKRRSHTADVCKDSDRDVDSFKLICDLLQMLLQSSHEYLGGVLAPSLSLGEEVVFELEAV